jgi:hypothetical protein
MGSAGESYLYCAAYGNGRFIVRGFGPGAFQMNGFQGDANAIGAQGCRRGRTRDPGDRSVGEGRAALSAPSTELSLPVTTRLSWSRKESSSPPMASMAFVSPTTRKST